MIFLPPHLAGKDVPCVLYRFPRPLRWWLHSQFYAARARYAVGNERLRKALQMVIQAVLKQEQQSIVGIGDTGTLSCPTAISRPVMALLITVLTPGLSGCVFSDDRRRDISAGNLDPATGHGWQRNPLLAAGDAAGVLKPTPRPVQSVTLTRRVTLLKTWVCGVVRGCADADMV